MPSQANLDKAHAIVAEFRDVIPQRERLLLEERIAEVIDEIEDEAEEYAAELYMSSSANKKSGAAPHEPLPKKTEGRKDTRR